MKRENPHTRKTMMLSHSCKAAGFIVAAVALAAIFILAGLHVDTFFRECCLSVAIIGLFMAAISRDRHEDEMLRQVRLAAVFAAFCKIVFYVVAYQPVSHFLHLPMVTAASVVFVMLLFYHIDFWIVKWRMRREKHD